MVDQISTRELADRLDAGASFALVDTRPAESYEAWHVRGAENVPFDPHEELSDDQLARVKRIADGRPVVAICGKGLTSTRFAFELEARGREDVTVVEGGMEAWSTVYDVVPVETTNDDLVIAQVQRRAKGCLGYVVGSRSAGEAAVVDATRQTDEFLAAAATAGLRVTRAVDTHVHADHVSGTPRLAESLGVPYHLGAKAAERDVAYDYQPVEDGDVVEVGPVELRALHAPGHTTEMVNYLVDGEYLLTGDTLFVDSVGRTELQFGDAGAEAGAEMLYETLQETILDLPDDTRVLPGHLAVTADGRYEGGTPGEPVEARLGDLEDDLDLLRLDRDAFVERLVGDLPDKPPNYERVLAINRGRETVEDEEEATELELGPNNCAA